MVAAAMINENRNSNDNGKSNSYGTRIGRINSVEQWVTALAEAPSDCFELSVESRHSHWRADR